MEILSLLLWHKFPPMKDDVIQFRIQKDKKKLLKKVAKDNEMSLTEFIMSMLEKHINPKSNDNKSRKIY